MPSQREYSPYLPSQRQHSHHYLLQLRKKQKLPKNRKATFSLCSIESKPSLDRPYRPPLHHRRKVNSLHSLEVRPEDPLSSCLPRKPVSGRVVAARTRTLQHQKSTQAYRREASVYEREAQTCSSVRIIKVATREESVLPTFVKLVRQSPSKQNKSSNLEHYIRCHANAHSKPLRIKKGKSRSILNVIQKQQVSIRHQKPSEFESKGPPQHQSVSRKENKEDPFKMPIDYLECSSIEKINESSFMSDYGRQELMARLGEEKRERSGEDTSTREEKRRKESREEMGDRREDKRTIEAEREEPERGKRKFKLSNKKLKQIFPCDFFQC